MDYLKAYKVFKWINFNSYPELFFINSVNAKQIYLECKRSEKEKDKENVTRVNITEYIFDKRKVTLKITQTAIMK